MSGLLQELGTPCPVKSRNSRNSDTIHTFDSSWAGSLECGDDTASLDFTTAIKNNTLIAVKPKRRVKTGTSFIIHDDNEERPTHAVPERKRESTLTARMTGRKSSLLAQPAHRFRPKVSFASSSPYKPQRQKAEVKHQRQNIDAGAETNRSLLMRINGREDEDQHKDKLKRDVRRNTVFIPPDDTTVASVFMRMFSPLKSDNLNHYVPEDMEINSLESQIARKRQAKRTMASGRKTPLHPSLEVTQGSAINVDIAGKNTGKENIPPGVMLFNSNNKDFWKSNTEGKINSKSPRAISDKARPSADPMMKPLARTFTSQELRRSVLSEKRHNARASVNSIGSKMDSIVRSNSTLEGVVLSTSRSTSISNALKQSKTIKSNASLIRKEATMKDFELISDDISNPAMYEDHWLAHQEIVITQLVNRLFDQTDRHMRYDGHAARRHELLQLYQSGPFVELHKRFQASLTYGSLSMPKDALTQTRRLGHDLGMKRKFLDIWLETYDLRALRAAAETVTGRRVENETLDGASHHSSVETTADKEKILRRKLERFLDVFLVQNRDMDRDAQDLSHAGPDTISQAYRRTVLRSIMMVILLDKARLCPGTMLPSCLFRSSSSFKSSAAVMQALARLLLPASGDILKSLKHLDCYLSYEQHQLQEYEYQMSNLAVDLRDGVRLTRIVELLLYPSAGAVGESVPLLDSDQWPLSRRLKFPCSSRTVKKFNVQIALDALKLTTGAAPLVRDTHAEDIVNGHREKTIGLLWGLVSRWGLSELIEWDDVRKEIDRLKQKATSQLGCAQVNGANLVKEKSSNDEMEDDEAVLLLKEWATILAHLSGLRLENLSTSFADGKIYEAIVNEYEEYILGNAASSPDRKATTLATRLRALGCSSQFANLVSPGNSRKAHIFDSSFTVGALAFLCSRLLSATKRALAAIVLQSAWRRVLAYRESHRRTLVRNLALQCSAVVQTRDRLLLAKAIILRWWRRMKRQRQQRSKMGSRSEKRLQAATRAPQRGLGRTRV
ncbi:abnormal spindle-like microcephaly-associated protein homolog [Aspergillus udagawae]|uniref:Abnormal spindle-like microcephaly-associated protein homolog n=1 Tax=Aspergillus udagawae TaxID=91492 RepID=A0ABQ1B8Y2_9EURO|nr:abnormal spindle-like microcephaly-associated protein homolog [Aspergillus udagawae]GFF94510.1 abnormal spindle-like microcephaly-associated protein homolog [Aspergillus udagawae]